MARKKRERSIIGYYHLILRGNGKMILFENPKDFKSFIKKMIKALREENVRLCAYCLMNNHVHMLVYDPDFHTPKMVQKLAGGYARYYNDLERTCDPGHVFQGPYKSDPVNEEQHLTNLFRYILNNPKKAGLGPTEKYRWSSYKAFFKDNTILYLDYFREKFPTSEAYREYIGTPNDDVFMEDVPQKEKHDDNWAMDLIRQKLWVKSGTEVKGWDKERRDDALRSLKDAKLTLRQISRLTGVSYGAVHRA